MGKFLFSVFLEPSYLIKTCIFQPLQFRQKVLPASFIKCSFYIVKLWFFIFLASLVLIILTRLLIFKNIPEVTPARYQALVQNFPFVNNWNTFLAFLQEASFNILLGLMPGLVLFLVNRLLNGVFNNFWNCIISSLTLGGSIGCSLGVIEGDFKIGILISLATSLIIGLVILRAGAGFLDEGGIDLAAGLVVSISGGYAYGVILGLTTSNTSFIASGIVPGFMFGILVGIVFGYILRFWTGLIIAVAGGSGLGLYTTFFSSATNGVQIGSYFGAAFFGAYLLGFWRLFLYPLNIYSLSITYFKSRKNCSRVFDNIYRSDIYKSEFIMLPLPFLTEILLIAARRNQEKTLMELTHLAASQPYQLVALHKTLASIIGEEMATRTSLLDMSTISGWLTQLPLDTDLIGPAWKPTLERLKTISLEAKSYRTTPSLQIRKDNLKMLRHQVQQMLSKNASGNLLSIKLKESARNWLKVLEYEQNHLGYESEMAGHIFNPYIPGGLLDDQLTGDNNLFVGRKDIILRIAETFNQGLHKPTFLLYGERRMGKTSILRQMSVLLGRRYLPILIDLQNVVLWSSNSSFFIHLSSEIFRVLIQSGYNLPRLSRTKVLEAEKAGELEVYAVFNEWLERVEECLQTNGQVILLMLDEFEKLEEIGNKKLFDIRYMLEWFRHIIQHHPQIALLFSGVKRFDEIGSGWSSYFINAQSIKVSFLEPEEARLLITNPIPHFNEGGIYSEEVVNEIMRITGCQPLLLQAVSYELISHLNTDGRITATLWDVKVAGQQVLHRYYDYFRDLWDRTNNSEKYILKTLQTHGTMDWLTDTRHLTGTTIGRSLEKQTLITLIRRDLVKEINGRTLVTSIPLLSEWIKTR